MVHYSKWMLSRKWFLKLSLKETGLLTHFFRYRKNKDKSRSKRRYFQDKTKHSIHWKILLNSWSWDQNSIFCTWQKFTEARTPLKPLAILFCVKVYMRNRHFRVFLMIRINRPDMKPFCRESQATFFARRLSRKWRLPFCKLLVLDSHRMPVEETRYKGPNPPILENLLLIHWDIEKGIRWAHPQQKISKLRLFSNYFSIKIPRFPFYCKNTEKITKQGWTRFFACVEPVRFF